MCHSARRARSPSYNTNLVPIAKLPVVIFHETPKSSSSIQLHASYTSCSQEEEFSKLLRIAEKGCLSVNTLLKGAEVKVSS